MENVTASPIVQFHKAERSWRGISNTTLPHSKKLQLILSVMSLFQTVLLNVFFFGINYHDKINGCNFTKFTGVKIK